MFVRAGHAFVHRAEDKNIQNTKHKARNKIRQRAKYMKQKAFTLIEVVIFVAILGLFFVAASAVSVATIRNMKANEHKILATRYAEELTEWLRSERNADWTTFIDSTHATQCGGSNKCFGSLDWSGECSSSCSSKIAGLFTRTASLAVSIPDGKVDVSVNVAWSEPGGNFNVPIKTVFTLNE